jgi:hypothetical protein
LLLALPGIEQENRQGGEKNSFDLPFHWTACLEPKRWLMGADSKAGG